MSWHWNMPTIDPVPEPEPPPIWIFVVLYFLIEVPGFLIALTHWPTDKSLVSGDFFANAFFLPLTVYAGLCMAVLSVAYAIPSNAASWWNEMRMWRSYHWLNWTRHHVAVVDSVVLTPENELAERMLGLEGAAPVNPDKILTLDVDVPEGASRMVPVLERLLTPLLPAVGRFIQTGGIEIVLQSERERDLTDLTRVMRKLGLPEQLAATSPSMVAPMDALWDGDKPLSGARLVLACQLQAGEDEPSSSELTVALLLAAPDALVRARLPIKPQAYLCRAIMAESDGLETALATLLGADQVPPRRIKHFWFSHLNKLMRHAITTAIKDASLNVATQDIDRAVGKPGHANGWLAQALAAQMVHHGQGAQLIATPCKTGVALNVAGPQPAVAKPPKAPETISGSTIWACGMMCILLFLFILDRMVATSASEPPFMPGWGYLLAWLALMVIRVGGEVLFLRKLSEEFESMYF